MLVRDESGTLIAKGVARPKSAEAIYARAMELVAQGADSADLAKAMSIPRAHAIKLHGDLFARIWPGVKTRFDPEALSALKEEMIESNLNTIQWVDEKLAEGKATAREINSKNGAMKILGQWAGFNAPTKIETTDRKVFALVNPAVHAQIMGRPETRAALLLLEEFASAEASRNQDLDVFDVALEAIALEAEAEGGEA